jgi:hypothetical protein
MTDSYPWPRIERIVGDVDRAILPVVIATRPRRVVEGTYSAERYNPLWHRFTADSYYDSDLRLWRNLAQGPEPFAMDCVQFLCWLDSASEDELETFARLDPLAAVSCLNGCQ